MPNMAAAQSSILLRSLVLSSKKLSDMLYPPSDRFDTMLNKLAQSKIYMMGGIGRILSLVIVQSL